MPKWRKDGSRVRRRRRATRRSSSYHASPPTPTITYTFEPTPEFRRLVEATPSGTPYWLGTGPVGTVCAQCSFYGYGMQYPNSCYRYFEEQHQHGAPLPSSTPSCLRFQPRNTGLCPSST
jgi:hypothetical protein